MFKLTSHDCFGFVHGYAIAACVTTPILQLMLGYVPLVYKLNFLLAIGLSIYLMLHEELRWQQAFLITKIVRWCVFRPKRFIQLQWWLLCWAFSGFKRLEYPAVVEEELPGIKFSRWETFNHFRTISKSMAQYDMQHWHTTAEILAELRAAAPTPYPFETNETIS